MMDKELLYVNTVYKKLLTYSKSMDYQIPFLLLKPFNQLFLDYVKKRAEINPALF